VTRTAWPTPRDADPPHGGTDERDESLARLRAVAEEQAALRRVATLVAGDPDPSEVFALVCAELGALLDVKSTNLCRFEGPRTARVVGAWHEHGAPIIAAGRDVPLDGETALVKVSRSGRPERIDDYTGLSGELPEILRAAGIASAVSAPIKVAGRLWGAIIASSGRPHGFPPDTEERIASFAELVADALANADAREQLAASRARIVEAGDPDRRARADRGSRRRSGAGRGRGRLRAPRARRPRRGAGRSPGGRQPAGARNRPDRRHPARLKPLIQGRCGSPQPLYRLGFSRLSLIARWSV
jgi:GAF domain-containing protein